MNKQEPNDYYFAEQLTFSCYCCVYLTLCSYKKKFYKTFVNFQKKTFRAILAIVRSEVTKKKSENYEN